jgi:hypothetical protein
MFASKSYCSAGPLRTPDLRGYTGSSREDDDPVGIKTDKSFMH